MRIVHRALIATALSLVLFGVGLAVALRWAFA